jgi:uncharacterized membrane protein
MDLEAFPASSLTIFNFPTLMLLSRIGGDMKIDRIKASVSLAAGVAIIIFMVFETVKAIQVMLGGATTTAHVISTFDDDRESDYNHRAWVVTIAWYEFSVNGRQFHGGTEVSQGSLSEGDHLTILYNPKNPEINRVRGDRKVLGDLTVIYLFGGIVAYFLIKEATRRKQESGGIMPCP